MVFFTANTKGLMCKYYVHTALQVCTTLHNSQSSSLIRMNVVGLSPALAFQPLLLISSKSNSAKKSSSNSSTLSFTMMKLLKDELLAGVKRKSVFVLCTSVRNVSTWKDAQSFKYN